MNAILPDVKTAHYRIKRSAINDYLINYELFIKYNPAISPDLALDFNKLINEIRNELEPVEIAIELAAAGKPAPRLKNLIVWPKSVFSIGKSAFVVVESKLDGDCALITADEKADEFSGSVPVGGALQAVPLSWSNLIRLKNLVLEDDPTSTIFPRAEMPLNKTSLGIGSRFTTLHWPAVAWAMKALNLPLTANQNSIPRELIYDVDAMLNNKLAAVPFPFIGASVPEGHQGQSVQGMSAASIVTYLKYGFHHNKIPWGFNADHQPIGGRFDAVERELVEGSLFATYITYDLSPELSAYQIISDDQKLDAVFPAIVEPALFDTVCKKLASLNLTMPVLELKRIIAYLMPAMKKMKQRDDCCAQLRTTMFTTDIGRRFFRELSLDELPGQTTPEMLAVCCALAEALGVQFNFIAPNVGFQKNFPYSDNKKLCAAITALYDIARKFNVSIGFHSGSGKSRENYNTIGKETSGNFEIKTSGRYTYELGVALSKSSDSNDLNLWHDWYEFTKQLAVTSAFSNNATQRNFARDFINKTLQIEQVHGENVFSSPDSLSSALNALKPSPDHPFWFEYNFLYILAGNENPGRLGDHSPAGYRQRSRFYRISDQGKLLFAQRVAGYILFLAGSTGMADTATINKAEEKLATYSSYEKLLEDIS
jgi:hypothetical protein